MNYIEYMQQPAGPITPALQLFNIPNQSVPEEIKRRLGMNSLAYKQLQDKTKQEAIRNYNKKRLSRDEIAQIIDPKTGKLQSVYNPGAGYLSGTDPLIKSVVDMTPVGDAEIIAEAGNQVKQGNIGAAAVLAGITLLPNIPGVNATSKKTIKEAVESLPLYARPNYQGDHLELAKKRLLAGGGDRIGVIDPPEVLANTNPKTGVRFEADHYTSYTKMRKPEPGEYLSKESYEKALKDWEVFSKNNNALAHEFEHFVHSPDIPMPESAVDPRYITPYGKRHYFTLSNNTELAARFSQLKNYFGLNEGEVITPEMWEYAKKHYIEDTGADNNMSDFFNLKIDNIQQFLDWGNQNALTLAMPVAIGSAITPNKNENH